MTFKKTLGTVLATVALLFISQVALAKSRKPKKNASPAGTSAAEMPTATKNEPVPPTNKAENPDAQPPLKPAPMMKADAPSGGGAW